MVYSLYSIYVSKLFSFNIYMKYLVILCRFFLCLTSHSFGSCSVPILTGEHHRSGNPYYYLNGSSGFFFCPSHNSHMCFKSIRWEYTIYLDLFFCFQGSEKLLQLVSDASCRPHLSDQMAKGKDSSTHNSDRKSENSSYSPLVGIFFN